MKDKNERDKRTHIPAFKHLLRHQERAEEKIYVAAEAEQHISY